MHMNASLIKCVILSYVYCTAYDLFQAEVADVKYQYFDFHNECKNMRWDRINILIEKMQDDLWKQGYGTVIDTILLLKRPQLFPPRHVPA